MTLRLQPNVNLNAEMEGVLDEAAIRLLRPAYDALRSVSYPIDSERELADVLLRAAQRALYFDMELKWGDQDGKMPDGYVLGT